jgi:hypothetical protein
MGMAHGFCSYPPAAIANSSTAQYPVSYFLDLFRYLIHLLSLAESLWLRYAQLLLRLWLWLQRKYLLRLSLMILCNWHDEKSRALTDWRSGKEAARRSYSEKPGMAASTLMSNACKY